jgi:16S rRNA (uracil1498-N3)-methyltransferase
MPRFFLSASNISSGVVFIRGDDALHISRSLRMKPGEHITVCDMQKIEYNCVLEKITSDTVTARIVTSKPSDNEPPYKIRLYQALPKSDKLDIIIQKAVESGVSEIIPFESERCVVKIDNDIDKEQKKLDRRRRIALEAAKQCGRGVIPEVKLPMSFDKMLNDASECGLRLFFYEGDGTLSLRDLLTQKYPRETDERKFEEIAVVVGAEGGFSIAETQKALEHGFEMCGLGKRILRCETASALALACLSFWFEM